MLESVILAFHVLVAVAIVVLVLLQHGRGADMGAAFGSGSSGSLFGASGSANFLSRATAVLATVFFVSSVALTYFGGAKGIGGGVIRPTSEPAAPAATAPAEKAPSDVPPVPSLPQAPKGGVPTPAAGQGAAPADAGSRAGEVPK